MKITCNSPKTSKGMILEGNTLSGDTFGVREHIKNYWGGKWDASRKVWIVDSAKVVSSIKAGTRLTDSLMSLSDSQVQATSPATSRKVYGHSTPCPKCGTYCYGDCGR